MEPDWQSFYEHLQEVRLDYQKIESEKIANYRFSESLFRQCQESRNRALSEALTKANTINEAIQNMLPIFYDSICLKQNIYKLFADLQIEKKIKHRYQSFMKNMTINDFISILLRSLKDRNQVAQMLLRMRVPLLIYCQMGGKNYFYPKTIDGLVVNEDYGVIFNIGTNKSRGKGKSEFIYKLFNLNKSYRYKAKSKAKLYENSFFVHSFCIEGKQKKILGDFNGAAEKFPQDLNIFIEYCSLLIFHAVEGQITSEKQFKRIEQFLNRKFCHSTHILLVVSGCQQDRQEIQQLLPETIRNKVTLFCYDQQIDQSMLIQVADQLVKKEAFKNLQRVVKSKNEKTISQIKRIIDMLPKQKGSGESVETFLQSYFPFTFFSNLIISQTENEKRLKNALKDMQYRQQLTELQQTQEKIDNLKQSISKCKLSKFVIHCLDLLQKCRYDQKKELQRYISSWKKSLIGPLQKYYVDQTNELIASQTQSNKSREKSLFLANQIRRIQKEIDGYDISLTTVINQLVLYLDNLQQEKLPFQKIEKTIQKTYFDCIKMNIPINFVDSKNLTFSNRIQTSLLKKISELKRTINKKIYVVSIIGAQSSAKSTLLNYLFRCNFETSAGRCTKGMYFNICQLGDKIIFIIDTEGLLSINGRDAQFDNRIATFILSISNLVIINNKGEINSSLKNLLQICMFVIKCIKKDISGKKQPQNIIFALRDQLMQKEGENIQESMLAKVHAQLYESSKKLGINYLDYFNIKSEDLFCFPSSINSQQLNSNISSFGIIEYYNQMFGQCVRGLRSRILEILESPNVKPFQSMQICGKLGATCWSSILACGPELLNYKTYLELQTKQQLEKILYCMVQKMQSKLKQKFRELFQKHKEDKSDEMKSKILQIENYINEEKQRVCTEYIRLFEEEGRKMCQNQEWLNQKVERIRREGKNIQILQRRKLRQEISLKQSLQKIADLEKLIESEIQKIINHWFQYRFQGFHYLQITIRQKKQEIASNLEKNELQANELHQLRLNVLKLIEGVFHEAKVGRNWPDWSEAEEKKNVNIYFQFQQDQKKKVVFCHSETKHKINEEVKNKIIKVIKQSIESQVTRSQVISSQFKEIFESENIKQELKKIVQTAYKSGKEYFERDGRKAAYSQNLKSFQQTQMQSLLKSVLANRLTNHIANLRCQFVQNMKKKLNEDIEQRIENMKDLFQIKGQLEKVSKVIFQSICRQQCRKLQQKVAKSLKEVQIKFIKDKRAHFTKLAYQKSINSKQSNRLKWIECFKMITNPVLYMKEILHNSQEIKLVKKQIKQRIESVIEQFQLMEIRKLVSAVEMVQNLKKQENINSEIRKLFSSYRIVNISKFQNQLVLKNIAKSFFIQKQYTVSWLYANHRQKRQFQGRESIVASFFSRQLITKLMEQMCGCDHQCPFCSAKCKLQKGHQGGHHVDLEQHYLTGFGGLSIENKFPIHQYCISKNFARQFIEVNGNEMRKLEYLQKERPEWCQYFKKVVSRKKWQSRRMLENLIEIRANIGDLLVSGRYKQISGPKWESKRKNPLTQKDLLEVSFQLLEGKFNLGKYLQK